MSRPVYTAVKFNRYNPFQVVIDKAAEQMVRDENLFFSATHLVAEDGRETPVFPVHRSDRWWLTASSGSPLATFGPAGERIC